MLDCWFLSSPLHKWHHHVLLQRFSWMCYEPHLNWSPPVWSKHSHNQYHVLFNWIWTNAYKTDFCDVPSYLSWSIMMTKPLKGQNLREMRGPIVVNLVLFWASDDDQILSHGYIYASTWQTRNHIVQMQLLEPGAMAKHCLSNPCIELLPPSHWAIVHKVDGIDIPTGKSSHPIYQMWCPESMWKQIVPCHLLTP